jgi:hypothetical protein
MGFLSKKKNEIEPKRIIFSILTLPFVSIIAIILMIALFPIIIWCYYLSYFDKIKKESDNEKFEIFSWRDKNGADNYRHKDTFENAEGKKDIDD